MKLVAGDNSTLKLVCKRSLDKSVIDLTGATVRLKYSANSGAIQTKVMTITTPVSGLVEYKFAPTDLAVGEMDTEVEITDVSGNVFTSLIPIHIGVRSKLA